MTVSVTRPHLRRIVLVPTEMWARLIADAKKTLR